MASTTTDKVKSLLRMVFSPIRWLFRLAFGILFFVFGRPSWVPPPWLIFSYRAVRNNFKRFLIGLAALGLIAVAVGWYKAHQPVKLSLRASPPEATSLKKDAKPDPVSIYFSGPAAPLDAVDKEVEKGIRMIPQIKGRWRWVGDSRLTFTPEEDWAVGQEYTVSFDRSMFPGHIHLKKYQIKFKSAKFEARIISSEFYQDPRDPKMKKVVATVKFTHPVDAKDFEKRVSLKMKEKKKALFGIGAESHPFTVSYDEFNGEAYIHSGPVTIPDEDSFMVLRIDEGVRSSRGGPATGKELVTEVYIPGVYNFFRITSANISIVRNERYEPEQVLIIETTAGVLESEVQKVLSAYVLPKDKPEMFGKPAVKNYHWYSAAEIGPEVLDKATSIELRPIPTEHEYSTLHSFKVEVEEGKHVYVRIQKGIKSFGDFILAKEFDNIIRVPKYPRELNIMHDGAILSLSGQKKLSILSRDLEAVKFEAGRVLPGQINHLVSQSGGKFSSPYFHNWNFSPDNITEVFSEIRSLEKLPHGKAQYSAFDFTGYVSPPGGRGANRGLFFFRAMGWDIKKNKPLSIKDSRLVLITDLGILVKDNADGSHDVFVMSIDGGTPVSDATVEVLGLNGLPVVTKISDLQGHVKITDLKDFKNEKKPTAYVVRKGMDISFIPFERSERNLDFSRFDTGGVYTQGKGDRLNAYLFSDRGIYRPGDRFNVGFIVKSNNWERDVTGIPLEAVITDPRGLEIMSRKFKLPYGGFEEVDYTTEENSPTGEYQVSVYIVKDDRRFSLLGSTAVRVEEFLPDRMKISTRFSEERREGWVSPAGLKAFVSLQNLYGTPASDRRVTGYVALSPAYPSFSKYKDYSFHDPALAEQGFTDVLKDQRTDSEGEAAFELDLNRFEKATYRLTFTAEGFEAEGGRAVVSQSSVLVSPLPYLIGYKPDGKLRYINRNSERYVDFIAVGPKLDRMSVEGLRIKLVEERYVSVLKKQDNGTFSYQSELKETTLKTEELPMLDRGNKYRLPTDTPGDFALVVIDAQDTELNKVKFSIVGAENLTRSLERTAELQIKLNKSDFTPGEEIELNIVAPYTGAGLITIEKDRVYAHKWFRTTTTSSVQRIRVPVDLEGNGYVNVSFVRAMNSKEIFMSPLSYGVEPFSVDLGRRDMGIKLGAPDLSRPGEPFVITYKGRQKGKAVIFAVDEGILQVAKYRTPDPLGHFFRKNALEVRTAQILDLIMPEYTLIRELSALGGGYDAEALGKNLNPFKRKRQKPVAYWSGIVDIDTTERKLVYDVPDYFSGKLRVMAVAVSGEMIGSAERSALVKGYFVLSPNVPTFVAPGDEFEVSVNVANNVEGSGKEAAVVLDIKTSKHLEVLDGPTRTLNIDEGREKSATFRIKARDFLGSGNFTFMASMGDKSSMMSVDLSVRPPVPYMVKLSGGYIKDGAVDVPVTRTMYPHLRTLEAAASPVPLGIAKGLTNYLRKYPYGCTEQLISQALPAIVLRKRPEFGYDPEKVDSALAHVMNVLRARQNSEGAFGFWAANSHVSEFQTTYAVHFLTEAKEIGYPGSKALLEKALNYMNMLAQRKPQTLAESRASSYAIYLLTRNGIVTTNYVSALHKHFEESGSDEWKKDLAGIYLAATYKMLKLDDKADAIIKSVKIGEIDVEDYENYYDSLVRDAQYLYILARHFPERLEKLKAKDIMQIVDPIINGHYNTISSAYTILALSAYADTVGNPAPGEISIGELLADGKYKPLVVPAGLFPSVEFSGEAKKIQIGSKSAYNIFYQLTEAGFDLTLPASEIKNKLEVQREYRDLKGNVVTGTSLGTELEVHLKVRAIERDGLKDIAIVDLLPGGFEVVLDPSARRHASNTFRADYVDMREDRVVIFGTADMRATEFVYRIRATNKGNYSVPPIFAEAMYDRSVKARTTGGKITVEGN